MTTGVGSDEAASDAATAGSTTAGWDGAMLEALAPAVVAASDVETDADALATGALAPFEADAG